MRREKTGPNPGGRIIRRDDMARTGMRLRATLVLGASAFALAGCLDTGNLDWDLRAGGGDTSDAARQATAAAPTPDGNGIISYPDYQMATARRGETVASMAGRLGMNPEELARTNALRPTDPLPDGEMLLLPKRVSATPQPAVIGGTVSGWSVDITSIATTALDGWRHRRHGATSPASEAGLGPAPDPPRRTGRDGLHHRADLQCLGQGAGGLGNQLGSTWRCARARP